MKDRNRVRVTETERERERGRQRETERDRERDRERESLCACVCEWCRVWLSVENLVLLHTFQRAIGTIRQGVHMWGQLVDRLASVLFVVVSKANKTNSVSNTHTHTHNKHTHTHNTLHHTPHNTTQRTPS